MTINRHRFAFCASTGRTATMFIASTLNGLPGVVGLHEGHLPGDPPAPLLPLINLQNRKAWLDRDFAHRTVAELRNRAELSRAAGDAELLVDVAFYNAPLLIPLLERQPESTFFAIFRRCEAFVLSATIVSGEDRQPAGWADRSKPLTDRERFIEMGRLRPQPGSIDAEQWPEWSAIRRNVWHWHHVNAHLLEVAETYDNCHRLLYEDLVEKPREFWSDFLQKLNLPLEPNLRHCVEQSSKKINQRPSYQIGTLNTWAKDEVAMYESLALPLERRIYD